MQQQALQRQQGSGASYAEIDEMNANEFDPEMQRRIAERIQEEAIQNNFENALEHSPEVFSEVFMLYVKMTVGSICWISGAYRVLDVLQCYTDDGC